MFDLIISANETWRLLAEICTSYWSNLLQWVNWVNNYLHHAGRHQFCWHSFLLLSNLSILKTNLFPWANALELVFRSYLVFIMSLAKSWHLLEWLVKTTYYNTSWQQCINITLAILLAKTSNSWQNGNVTAKATKTFSTGIYRPTNQWRQRSPGLLPPLLASSSDGD